MSEEKKNEVTEEVKEARELTEEELEKVNGGVLRRRDAVGQYNELFVSYVAAAEIHGVEDEGAIPPCR
ncbi:MAG: bacteriocin [Eubacteriales bacterium]|nr:bacteriocin [Eubacteriales bacterium]